MSIIAAALINHPGGEFQWPCTNHSSKTETVKEFKVHETMTHLQMIDGASLSEINASRLFLFNSFYPIMPQQSAREGSLYFMVRQPS